MKRISIIIAVAFFVLVSGFQSGFAQDYRLILDEGVAFFSDEFGSISSLKIDSVKSESGAEILYTMPNIDTEDPFCVNPKGTSWIGSKIVRRNDLTFFFNTDKDTIKIKPSAALNEPWIAFENTDSLTILAEVTEYDEMAFLGVTDSVKKIEFTVYDKDENVLDWELSSMNIRLSKNYGLLTALNFSLFPDLEKLTLTDIIKLHELELAGLSAPELGMQNLTWFEAFDFAVGDELHEISEYRSFGPDCPNVRTYTEKIDRYLESVKSEDSLVYKIERKFHIIKESMDEVVQDSKSIDTVNQKIFPDPYFDVIPGQPVISNGELFANFMYNANRPLKHYRPLMNMFSYSEGCGSIIFFDGCFNSLIYQKGLGGPYSRCEGGIQCFTFDENKLVYYKKGNETWGTPLEIDLGFSDDKILKSRIYPNPSNGSIQIELAGYKDQNYHLRILNSLGALVLEKTGEISGPVIHLDLLNQKNGLYFVELKTKDKTEQFKLLLINQ